MAVSRAGEATAPEPEPASSVTWIGAVPGAAIGFAWTAARAMGEGKVQERPRSSSIVFRNTKAKLHSSEKRRFVLRRTSSAWTFVMSVAVLPACRASKEKAARGRLTPLLERN